jgi:hypothetical protein
MSTTTPKRLTDSQIRNTVAQMGYSPKVATVMLQRALAGEPTARFAVYAAFRKIGKGS